MIGKTLAHYEITSQLGKVYAPNTTTHLEGIFV